MNGPTNRQIQMFIERNADYFTIKFDHGQHDRPSGYTIFTVATQNVFGRSIRIAFYNAIVEEVKRKMIKK